MPSAYNVVDPFGQIQPGGDRIVVAGEAQNTGRPAVAFSDDRGRTWKTHAFTDLPCTKDCNENISVQSSADGTTLYAMVEDPERRQVYVYSKHLGGSWTRTGDVIAYTGTESFYRSFVAADGTRTAGTGPVFRSCASRPFLLLAPGLAMTTCPPP
ncbi:sialidase family protein [Dactylosporangium sp. McL0621]|uniref:sialidase family protein n=1 Tax=Dactylosporangium sp. McL0621 TaxID=3415678 RepID=UPI003CF25CAC